MTDLKPCPFCGEPPEVSKHFKLDAWSLTHRCPIIGYVNMTGDGFCEDLSHAKAMWNTRHEEPET